MKNFTHKKGEHERGFSRLYRFDFAKTLLEKKSHTSTHTKIQSGDKSHFKQFRRYVTLIQSYITCRHPLSSFGLNEPIRDLILCLLQLLYWH